MSDDVQPSVLRDSSVLVTGGAGAFGRAFVARALADGARRVVVFSRDEAKHAAMQATVSDDRVRYFVGDVRDLERLRWAVRGCDIVVHAAAMKRVDTCEANPQEAVDTNITGTGHVARAVIREGVARAVFLSTDKAASPATHYGLTKSCAERLWVQTNTMAAGTGVILSATRYGNVLGSTGSVVPIWRRQVERGEMLRVTEPDATRFWMPMSAAVQLVVTALTEMRGGETFVPKLRSASVGSLRTALYPDATWGAVGLQSGEKMHETLIGEDEAARTIDCGAHYAILPAAPVWGGSAPFGVPVPPTFVLRSDTAVRWTVEELRSVVR